VAFSGILETFEAFGLSQDSCIVNFGRDGSSGPSGPGGQWVAGSPGAGAVQWLFWAKRPLADWFTWLIDPSRCSMVGLRPLGLGWVGEVVVRR